VDRGDRRGLHPLPNVAARGPWERCGAGGRQHCCARSRWRATRCRWRWRRLRPARRPAADWEAFMWRSIGRRDADGNVAPARARCLTCARGVRLSDRIRPCPNVRWEGSARGRRPDGRSALTAFSPALRLICGSEPERAAMGRRACDGGGGRRSKRAAIPGRACCASRAACPGGFVRMGGLDRPAATRFGGLAGDGNPVVPPAPGQGAASEIRFGDEIGLHPAAGLTPTSARIQEFSPRRLQGGPQ